MRRHGRVCAMQVLYQMDVLRGPLTPGAATRALAQYFDHFDAVAPAEQAFAERLVRGVVAAQKALDAALSAASHHWRLARMGRVDRSVLRLAAFEIVHCADIPRAVSINEAVEIAKRFGSQESAAFVNGILDQLAPEALPVAAIAPHAAAVAAAGAAHEPPR